MIATDRVRYSTTQTGVLSGLPGPFTFSSEYDTSFVQSGTSFGPLPESGYSVTAADGSVAYFYVSDAPARFGHCMPIGVGNFTDVDGNNSTLASAASQCYTLAEWDFFADDDALQQAPLAWSWLSGQSSYNVSTVEIQAGVQYAHSLGLTAIAYKNLAYDYSNNGVAYETLREHPDWCAWDSQNVSSTGSGQYYLATGNPGLIDYHCAQLSAARSFFGFDGFRDDATYVYDTVNNTSIFAQIRAAAGTLGQNTEMWQFDLPVYTAMPISNPLFTGDYYSEVAAGESIILHERFFDSLFGQPWSLIASNIAAAGRNAWRAGGNAYLIARLNSVSTIDSTIVLALMLSNQCHVYGSINTSQAEYLQFACRYARLIWGKNAQPIAVTTTAGWVNAFALDGIYYCHVVNQPTNANAVNSTLAPITPTITFTVPTAITAAWVLTADGGISKTSVPFTQVGSSVIVTASVDIWSIIVIE